MAGQEFVTPLTELAEVWRPRHQMYFPIWETREKISLPQSLGFPRVFVNGEEFVLAKNGATALKPGLYVESVITRITETNITKAVGVLSEQITVEVGTTTVTENQFQDGYLLITGGAADVIGHRFPIKGNSAGGGTAADTITVRLAVEMPIALNLTTDIAIYTSPYANLVIGSAGTASTLGNSPRGIPCVAVEANYYFWAQKKRFGIAQINGVFTVDTESQSLKAGPGGQLSPVGAHVDVEVATLLETVDVADGGWALVDMDF